MAIQLSVRVRNARLDVIESDMGATPIVELRSGAQPANCAAAGSGTLLAQSALPADWLAAASGGTKAKAGTWTLTGLAGGDIGHFRIYRPGSPSECDMQGSVTATGGGGDMTVDNITIALAQICTVNTFVLTDGNA
jgi:hypothetical protein